MITVSKATHKNKAAIQHLLLELGRPQADGKKQMAFFEDLIRLYTTGPDKHILVAHDAADVVGLASAVVLPRLNRVRPELWIPELVVSKKHRNKGVGKKLMISCIALAKRKNCFRIRLESGKNRKLAHKFYKKMGLEAYAVSFSLGLG
jgi:GNAT superfamily N-acetyltransferase